MPRNIESSQKDNPAKEVERISGNNIEKFDSDFRFQLTRDELNELVRSNFLTSRRGNAQNLPSFSKYHVFNLYNLIPLMLKCNYEY